jgi:mRNA interferase MazF
VVSPDELNENLTTVIVAPLTTGGHPYAMRIPCTFRKRRGFVVLDQLRTVDVDRLVRRLGRLSSPTLGKCLASLREMFKP